MATDQGLLQIGVVILAILSFVGILYLIAPWFADIISRGKIMEVFMLWMDGFVQLGEKLGGLVGWMNPLSR